MLRTHESSHLSCALSCLIVSSTDQGHLWIGKTTIQWILFKRIMTILQHYSTSTHHTSSYIRNLIIILHHDTLYSHLCSYIHIIHIILFPCNSLFNSLLYPTSTRLQKLGPKQHPTPPVSPGEFVIRSNSSKRNCVSR